MHAAPFNADDAIIPQIDAGVIRPKVNEVARALLRKMNFEHDIIARYDRGENSEPMSGHDALWRQIDQLPSDQQGALRLVVSLAHYVEIDWYTAEFFILWARQAGLSEHEISEAFGVPMNES